MDTHALPDNVLTTQLKKVVNWARRSSLWPMPFATACCGIELMATASSRYDLARFGAEAMRFRPRQSDLMIVAGRVTIKMMPVLQHIYQQMTEPKWVISMGACASTGGVFDAYATIQGIDQFMPVDVYVPGCPPRPETLIEGIMAIQRIIDCEGHAPRARAGRCRSPSSRATSPSRSRRSRSPWTAKPSSAGRRIFRKGNMEQPLIDQTHGRRHVMGGLILAIVLCSASQLCWKKATLQVPDGTTSCDTLRLTAIEPMFWIAVGLYIWQFFNWMRVLKHADPPSPSPSRPELTW